MTSWWRYVGFGLIMELREVLRDRRALLLQIGLPLFIIPLTVSLMFAVRPTGPLLAQTPVIATNETALIPLLIAQGATIAPRALQPAAFAASAAALHELRTLQVPALLTIDASRAEIVVDHRHPHSQAAEDAAWDALQVWRETERSRLLSSYGVTASQSALPISVYRPGSATATMVSKSSWAMHILLTLMITTVAVAIATDLLAGAKERGSRDWYLAMPVPRSAQVASTTLAVFLSATVAGLLHVLMISFSLGFIGNHVHSGGLPEQFIAFALPGLVMVLPVAAAAAGWATALASGAASTREAQATLLPVLLAMIGLAMVGGLATPRQDMFLDLVPVAGLVSSLREISQGTGAWYHVGLAMCSTVAAGLVGWLLAVRLCIALTTTDRAPVPETLPALLIALLAVGCYVASSVGLMALAAPIALVASGPLLVLGSIPLLATRLARWDLAATFRLTRPVNLAKGCGLAAIGVVGALTLGLMQTLLFQDQDGAKQIEQQMITILSQIYAQGGAPLLVLVVAVCPALGEELLCRGLILGALQRRLGNIVAIIGSALIFAALHMSPYRFFPQFFLGVCLALMTLRCNSLYPAILVHFLYNATLILAAIASEPRLTTCDSTT